tara:strand:+ start:720 stop:1004 length:285 start_codon:yes stop_codon:yes gene_type:complete
MEYTLEIKPRNSELITVLILGLQSIQIDKNGFGRDNKQFSRITLRYLNSNSQMISFRSDEDDYAMEIYNKIKKYKHELLEELRNNGQLSDYFVK